jgi:hypothetical protein
MSFGFGVGDFLAVGELAKSLYEDIYKVARDAPKDVEVLSKDLSVLRSSIDLLVSDSQDPDSILIKAGQDRVNQTNEVMRQTNQTLQGLDQLLRKYNVRRSAEGFRAKTHLAWDKVKYALDKDSTDELRMRLQYHNGSINVLLTSIGNSSLRRVEQNNEEVKDKLGEILQFLKTDTQAPILSSIDESQNFKANLSTTFLQHAEVFQPWISTAFEQWVQVGKWWLLKAQKQLSALAPAAAIPPQAYADLLKSAWILVDILSKHPEAKYWEDSEEYESIVSLADVCQPQPRPNLRSVLILY